MRRKISAIALGMVLAPAALSAQACFGVPQGVATAVGLAAQFPESATSFEVQGLKALANSLFVDATVGTISYDVDGYDNEIHGGVGVGYELSPLAQTASVCPQVGVGYSTWEDYSAINVPVGLGIGRTIALDERGSMSLTPYVTPQFNWARYEFDGESETDTYFLATGGATLGFDRFFVGATVSKVFEDETDVVFGVRGGFAF